MCSAKTRASVVVAPPAGNGTILVTGRAGQACAHAMRRTAGSAAAPAATCKNARRGSFMFEPPSRVTSLDHLVRASEQRRRHIEAERLGGGQIDDEVELGWLLDRNV